MFLSKQYCINSALHAFLLLEFLCWFKQCFEMFLFLITFFYAKNKIKNYY